MRSKAVLSALKSANGYACRAAMGELRTYKGGNIGGVYPLGLWALMESAWRYSTVDLDGSNIQGGHEHDWTLGANWYLSKHLKLHANYIRAFSDRKVNPPRK